MFARMVYISYICVMQKHTLPPYEGGAGGCSTGHEKGISI